MQKYRLTRILRSTEVMDVECVNWDEAFSLVNSDELEFEPQNDEIMDDYKIEYLGESNGDV